MVSGQNPSHSIRLGLNFHLDPSKLDLLPYWDFIKEICKSKFLFIPNIYDASPRTLTQSLSCNVPVLLNYNILGGWKYINKYTGEFFNDEKDFHKKVEKSKFSKFSCGCTIMEW